jgi:predicted dehydrogenase
MSKIIRAGLVGCGSLSQRGVLPHLCQDDAREKVALVAVTDVVEDRARATAQHFGIPAHFTTVETMLEACDLDLVLVITPIPYHFDNAMTAIAAGKHVYVQKAMTETLDQANQLLAARDRAGIKLAAAPGYELFPTTGQMRRVVADGVLGQVGIAYTYTMGFGHEHEPIRGGEGTLAAIDPSWYYRPGGGPLPDVTIYAFQLITSLLGPVRRVTALANKIAPERTWKGQSIPVEIEDNNVVLMEFASGTLGVATGSNVRGSRRVPWGGVTLFGSAGVLEITEVHNESGYPVAFDVTGGQWTDEAARGPREFQAQVTDQPYIQGAHVNLEEQHVYADIMDLVDAIREDRPPRSTGEQARHVVEIIEKALLAARTGQSQTLDSTFVLPTAEEVV